MVACSINLHFLLLTSTILLTLHSNVYFHHSNLLISLVIALIYRPPSSSLPLFLEEFSLLTETLYMHSSLFFILGDFISPHNNKLNPYSLNIIFLIFLILHILIIFHSLGFFFDSSLSFIPQMKPRAKSSFPSSPYQATETFPRQSNPQTTSFFAYFVPL